jgi:hypothetical protein
MDMGVVGALADAVKSFIDSGPGAAAPGYLLVATIPVVLAHELGHAIVAARRLGGPVHISVGGTGALLRVRLRRLTLAVNAVPRRSGADGFASFDAARATARDVTLIALAGPAASLLCAVLGAIALSSSARTSVVHNFMWAVTAVGLLGVLNLVPFDLQERRGGPRLRSDGRLALEAARASRALR